jgi:putative transcriptional regulator
MNYQEFDSLKGHFLIAMPSMADPNFINSVTCICEHAPAGALGLTINRDFAGVTSKQIFSEFNLYSRDNSPEIPVYTGGPVQKNEIFILHTAPFNWLGTHIITPELALSNTMDLLEALAAGTGPEKAIILLGCAGWGAGQLDFEIRENAWLTQKISNEIVFNTPMEKKWDTVVQTLGFDPSLLSNDSGHA